MHLGKLRNLKHETFAQGVAAGDDPADAYVQAGFARNRANHHRLARQPHVAARIVRLREQRERNAAAARMQPAEILAALRDRAGVVAVADFFAADAGGALKARDLRAVPVEAATAFTRSVRASFGLPIDFEIIRPDRVIDEPEIMPASRSRGQKAIDPIGAP